VVANRQSGNARRISHAGTTLFLALSLTGMVRVAYADCTPNSAAAASGAIVICSATSAGGFVAGAGVTGLTVNVASGTLSQALFAANTSVSLRVNASSNVTNSGLISNTGGTGTGTGGGNGNIGVWLMGADSSFTNNGTGSVNVSILAGDIAATPGTTGPNVRTVTGVLTTVASEDPYLITNRGTISVEHAGVGPVRAIFAGGATVDMTVDNFNTISLNRSSPLTLSVTPITNTNGVISGGVPQANPHITGVAVANLGLAAAIDAEEELEHMTIINRAGGVISATGNNTNGPNPVMAIFGRAGELEVFNHGTITSTAIAIANVDGGGDDDDGGAEAGGGETELHNTGTITGDILFVDASPLRYWLSVARGIAGINLNNQTGIRSSEVENSGIINGNFYLGSGEHEIVNTGTINGDIHVNQTEINAGILGEKVFTLVNSGTLTGDIHILDTAGATNTITLVGGGFGGSITATGTGSNTLNLLGNGTVPLAEGITALNVGFAPAGEEEEEEDEDEAGGDDDDAPAAPAASTWTIAANHELTVAETSIGNGGVLIVNGELESEEIDILSFGSLIVNDKVESEEINVRAGGLLVVNAGGEIEIEGDDDDAGVHVFAGGTLMGAGTIEGNVFNHGTIDLRTTTLTVEGAVHLYSGSIIKTRISGAGGASPDTASANAGQLVVSETGTTEAGAKIFPVSAAGVVRTGDWYVVAHNSEGEKVFDALPGVQNSALINWQIRENAANDVVIGATVKNIGSIPGFTSATANTLNSLLSYSGDNEKLNALISRVQGLLTEEELKKAGDKLRPEVNGAQTQAALSATDRAFSVVDNRLSQTQLSQLGHSGSGVSTGESGGGKGVWAQVFGFQGDQDTRQGVDGYSASTAGFALGADTAVGDGNTRVGAALSYAYSSIEDDGVNQGNTSDVKSYQLSLYGSRLLEGDWYVNGSLGFGMHQYDTRRLVVIGGPAEVVTGNHDGQQYSARVEIGKAFTAGGATVIPMAGVFYSHLKQDGYTETSSGGSALAIEGSSVDSIRSIAGARGRFGFGTDSTLEVRAAWLHEFGDTNQDTTASFAAGGASFTTSGVEQDKDAFNIGASLTFNSSDKTYKVMLSYDAEIKDQYIGHTALLQARYEF